MLQPRIGSSSIAAARDASVSLSHVAAIFNTLTLCPKHSHLQPQLPHTFIRHASHAAQGRANGPKDSAGRRLGAKKTASQYVIPGNIIFRQRGTKWFPGENVDMGKDHTIYATVAGYVRYYKDPAIHPKRRYIGVALDKEGPRSKLPTPANAPTRRRLGMYATPIKQQNDVDFLSSHMTANSKGTRPLATEDGLEIPTPITTGGTNGSTLKPGTFWISNYEIGKAAERKGVQVREFDRKDRWLAWRKRTKRVKEKMLARAAKANRKSKGKKSNKGVAPAGKK